MRHFATPEIKLVLIAFFALYFIFLIRRAQKDRLDLYDLVMLGSVATFPLIFVLFPAVSLKITEIIGVQLPFLWLFGTLHLISFVYLFSVASRIKKSENRLITLTQEMAMAETRLEKLLRQAAAKEISLTREIRAGLSEERVVPNFSSQHPPSANP
ncbi:MAG: DUF2304 domain-containing protein [Bdellovibrionales bacterium]